MNGQMISPNVVILTRDELTEREDAAFQRGIKRGRIDERTDQARRRRKGPDGA